MFVPLPLEFHFKILATMNNKKQDKKPLFAEVNLTGDDIKVTLGHQTFWDGNHALALAEELGFCNTTLVEF